MFSRKSAAFVAAVACLGAMVGVAAAGLDFGQQTQKQIDDQSNLLFGFNKPVAQSSTTSAPLADAIADATKLVTLAKGLQATVVTSGNAAPNLDQMVLWPPEAPTHIIACNEQGPTAAGVQRIDLATGVAETILTGTNSCDPVRVTPWGTLVVAEESGNTGQLLEIVDPLHTTGVQFNRVTHTVSGTDAANVAVRLGVGMLSYESLAFYPTGVLYYGDENRPSNGTQGGAYFKFVPAHPWDGSTMITTADQLQNSPLVSGTIYGLRVGKRGQPAGSTASGNDYGQGTQTGLGAWINMCAPGPCAPGLDLRAATPVNKLTGFYRPEDAEIDQPSFAAGNVKFCANNTGNEGEDHTWGEAICITDGTFGQSLTNTASPEVQYLVIGSVDLAMPDNIAQQPGTNNWVIHEDGDIATTGKNNDLWICLPDGADADSLTDGCARMGTLNDLPTNDPASANHGEGAEWTGGFFDPTGKHFFVSVQHNMTGFGVILDITGF